MQQKSRMVCYEHVLDVREREDGGAVEAVVVTAQSILAWLLRLLLLLVLLFPVRSGLMQNLKNTINMTGAVVHKELECVLKLILQQL